MPQEAKRKAAIVSQVTQTLAGNQRACDLAPLLFARPPADDLAGLDPRALAGATLLADAALAAHRPDTPFVQVESPEGFAAGEEALQLITLVNDDRPFLFDSVVAELAETAPEIRYVSHPVLEVERNGEGEILSFAATQKGAPRLPGRVSLIQVATAAPADAHAGERLCRRLLAILQQVAAANEDFYPMRERVSRAAYDLSRRAERTADADTRALVDEAARFLEWLAADNFTFLGVREFEYTPDGESGAMRLKPGSELGILRDPDIRVLRGEDAGGATSPELRAFLEAPAPLIVAKANTRSVVHRRVYMDYIGIKQYDAKGRLSGELRVAGLFTSAAYTQPILSIPYLRQKAETVISRFGLHPKSHSARALLNALETYSRDEIFQIEVDLLEEFIGTVLELGERPRIRVLTRIDPFDRFASVTVFVPRERYDQRLREEIAVLLAEAYQGHVSAYYPSFPEGPLAQVHFIIGRRGGATPRPDVADLESRITDMSRNWLDAFQRAMAGTGLTRELAALAPGLPLGYRDAVAPRQAVEDGRRILSLSPERPLAVHFHRPAGDDASLLRLRLYTLGEALPLSRRVPVLENMGFSVGSEQTFEIRRADGSAVHLHDMDLARPDGGEIALADDGRALGAAFEAVFAGRIENDGFNALVLEAGLDWLEANVLRAYGRYLRQTGLSYPDAFLASVLRRQPEIARALFALFAALFDPARDRTAAEAGEDQPEERLVRLAVPRGAAAQKIVAGILQALDKVESLDDDRVLRRFAEGMLATLRTNHFAIGEPSAEEGSRPGAVKPALAFKLDPHALENLPQPVPYREIFVFDARVEGVHLRFGPVARGGLRWSDRSQDYRTEVLGLVKAQQVKNAVIVPVGAKGGFYPKRLPDPARRDEWFEAGRSAYVVFIASLLSVTDNIEGEETVTPERVVAHDGPDPYFVVAADKGTATFSDTANAIAQAEGFWLDDAFASGGSAGYDHKGMGITARGAWEAVKRHFREMNRDIQAEPFTVAGCGDMSGDVFGNGMLLSEQTRLVAAFDHRDIFIDPDPDPASAFAERRRLFERPRSSWADYDRALLSKGGLIASRRDKRVRLSAEAAEAIGWDRREGTPAEIIAAILKAPVDLLWFGGIGTYVRSAAESNADVGDRANDAVRVSGRELRAKVIGEGANLGATQRGRIEFARAGGRINTDAIDNSAGVNTSDVEVNIKIALKRPLSEERLGRPARDTLLAEMTDEVARLVLANNYTQSLAISLEERGGAQRLSGQSRLMQRLEEAGELDRAVEWLPTDAAIADLRGAGRSLTRPEIAVLLAYAKIDLFDRLAESDLLDDPWLRGRLLAYFPSDMREGFGEDIEAHRLRREIVATQLANEFINRLGVASASFLMDATGADAARIAGAFVAASEGLAVRPLLDAVDALDNKVDGETQLALYQALSAFLFVTTIRLLRIGGGDSLKGTIEALAGAREDLAPRLLALASERAQGEYEKRLEEWRERGVPEELAEKVALLPLLALLPEVGAVSRETGCPLDQATEIFFRVTRLLRIGAVESALLSLRPTDYYEILSLERSGSHLSTARRRIVAKILTAYRDEEEPVAAWEREKGAALPGLVQEVVRLAGSGDTSLARLSLAVGLLTDLSE